VTSLDQTVAGNNMTIFGSQFFTNYYGVFINNFTTFPTTQTAHLYIAQNALPTTLLSSVPRTTGSDVFPSPPTPTPTVKSHKGLIIGLGVSAGILLIGVIVVVVLLVQAKKKER